MAARIGTGYGDPRGLATLREALARRDSELLGQHITADEVVVTVGAKQALAECLRALVEEGDEVLVLAPYWPTYVQQIGLAGARALVVPPDPCGHPDGWGARSLATPRTKAIIVNDPHNPTSTVLADDAWEELGSLAAELEAWLVVDGVYRGLVHGPALAPKRVPRAMSPERVVWVDGFSKSFGLSGLRVGYAVAPRPLADAIVRMVTSTTTCPSILSQCTALVALSEQPSLPRELATRYRTRVARGYRVLTERLGADRPPPEAGFYLFPRFSMFRSKPGTESGDALAEALRAGAGLKVCPGRAFGVPDRIRIAATVPDDAFDEALLRIEAMVLAEDTRR